MGNDSRSQVLCHVLTVIDGSTEELLDVAEIKGFELHSFQRQFDVCVERDGEMLDRYAVGPDDVIFLQAALGYTVQFNFQRYAYFIEAATKDVKG